MSYYVPIVVLGALSTVFAVSRWSPARSAGQSGGTGQARSLRMRHRADPQAGIRFPVKYYLTAMLFIVFDIEIIFLYPWAVAFDRLGASAWSRR